MLSGLFSFVHAEAVVTMETPPQWRVVEVVAMEDQRRWKGLFDYIQKFGEWRSYPVALGWVHGYQLQCVSLSRAH